jgi:phage tail-like protein
MADTDYQAKFQAQEYVGRKNAAAQVLDDIEGNMIFALEIEGIEIANFIECSGIKRSTEVFEIQEGGLNEFVHKLPGQTRWENIVLRYGVTGDSTMQAWAEETLQDEFEKRRAGAIVIKRLNGDIVRRYSFQAAWPVAWEGPAFNANGADLAIEMLEIAHHGMKVEIIEPKGEARQYT